ncbi:MAG: hypothetical protein JO170_15365, partial [Verrucomicrobia bacterium]|nr:hypothetical protein [Verrucomicrobiota bacterium]
MTDSIEQIRFPSSKYRSVPWLIIFTVFLTWSDLRAQTTNWIAPGSANWFTATDWSNGIPTLSSTATIANGGTAQIIGSTGQVGTLTIGTADGSSSGSLNVTGGGGLQVGTLTVQKDGTINSNGSGIAQIDAGGTVANSGTISGLSGLELNGGGTVTNSAGGSIQGSTTAPVQWPYNGGVTISTGTVTNAGTISGENGVVFTGGGGSVTNQAGGVIQGIALNDNGYDSNTGSGIYAFANSNPVTIVNGANATIEGTGTYSWGIHTGSTPISVDNYGLISGNVDGINNNGDSQIINEQGGWITSSMESAIATTNGSNTVITNSGNILSTATDGSPAIAMFYGGTINNNAGGVITGQDGNAIGIGYQGDTGPTTLSNSGTINGNVTLADLPNTFSNAGKIFGTVNLGNGANTAALITGGIISGALNLGTGSALVLDGPGQQSLSQAVTGSITSPGSLTKTGTGTWTIDENLSAPGSTEIKSGILKVNDTLSTPTLTVDAPGTLGGAGTIVASNVINYGTIAPGDPQTLTIAGNYTQEAGGNLQIDIEGTGTSAYAYDVLLVTGAVTLLPDSVLTLDFLNGFDPVAGDTFDFLQPGGGLTGSFGQVVVEGLSNGLEALLQSDGSNGYEIAMV